MTDYKRQDTRVVPIAGRHHVQLSHVGGGDWVTIAIRENEEVARALVDAILVAVRTHTDDAFAFEAIRKQPTVPDPGPARSPDPFDMVPDGT